MKFFSEDFLGKYEQTFLWICSYLPKKTSMENFSFYKVVLAGIQRVIRNMFLELFLVCFTLNEPSKI